MQKYVPYLLVAAASFVGSLFGSAIGSRKDDDK